MTTFVRDSQIALCGLFDRIERVTKAYDEDTARRQLMRKSG